MTKGKVHDYLGMTIDYSKQGCVQYIMDDYVEGILAESPQELLPGRAETPAASYLFEISDSAEPLSKGDAERFHHLTAKLLYLCKRARPDLQTAVSFLATRVQSPTTEDEKKLWRCIAYLKKYPNLRLTLRADDDHLMHWWVDAAFAVHHDMRSHTGGTFSMGKGSIFSTSTRQKLNTKSSTEAELVGVDDMMPLVLWTREFLKAQGYPISDNVVYQDNKSAILLENNGKISSGKRTRHLNIRYYFVTDRINNNELKIEYCPTEEMVADFFTKPLQGSLFRKLRATILNLDDEDPKMNPSVKQECVGPGDPHSSVTHCPSLALFAVLGQMTLVTIVMTCLLYTSDAADD